jgi:hypothetical protein
VCYAAVSCKRNGGEELLAFEVVGDGERGAPIDDMAVSGNVVVGVFSPIVMLMLEVPDCKFKGSEGRLLVLPLCKYSMLGE